MEKKIKFSIQIFVLAMVAVIGFYGCAQMSKVANDNPELIVKVNDLIGDIVKIAGSELIAQMTRSEDVRVYFYIGTRLRLISGFPVKGLAVQGEQVIATW
jgi:hypothetical protein